MINIIIIILLIFAVFVYPSFAERWIIEREGESNEIQMRSQYNPDPIKKYRGEIEDDGSVRMRDLNGNILRGNIDDDGYGNLRDLDGNTYRVRPR